MHGIIGNLFSLFYVALGSALGGVLRYALSLLLNPVSGFPWGTFAVNVIGSLAIGVLSGWIAGFSGNAAAIRAFAVVGFCGGFTTFSTFSNESFRMLENGQWFMLSVYLIGSVAAGLAAVWLGYQLTRNGI